MNKNPDHTKLDGKRTGRPKGVGEQVLLERADRRKQRRFAKLLNKHIDKTLSELEKLLKDKSLPIIELMAIQTLIRAASIGATLSIELVLSSAPGAERRVIERIRADKVRRGIKRVDRVVKTGELPSLPPPEEPELPSAGEFDALEPELT